ncbi:MAG TPA: DUF72 domain-containing protein [Rhizomicrobium sp.]|jgi:uncharacterized protein YecE (DUF72 family)|nr:DUF72 domain-containing protein [Rhizomicrobium sp.]
MSDGHVHVGTAGWSLRREQAARFGEGVSQLARYATRLTAVEINSSFYRPHRAATYARWAASVPADFRFAVKLPKAITHERRLVDVAAPLERFLSEAGALGGKLGPLLVQLPPSLAFDDRVARDFFAGLRARFDGAVVCEPRHASWFAPGADNVLAAARIARVAADPAPVARAQAPGGDRRVVYFRWHGSPRVYYSNYETGRLAVLAARLREARAGGADTWCIFDNTALGAATENALQMRQIMA